jgi:hypothetical protein
MTLGPIMPINTTPLNMMSKGDTVVCTFTDETNKQLVILGSATKKADIYAAVDAGISVFADSTERDAAIPSPSAGRMAYVSDVLELQFYNGSGWVSANYVSTLSQLHITGELTVDSSIYGSSASLSGSLIANSASVSTLNVTGNASINGLLTTQEVSETVTSTSIAANTLTISLSDGCVFHQSASASANYTVNITNVPTTVNRATTVTLIASQGASAYIPNALQIDGASVAIKWAQGGTPSGTPNKYDIFTWKLLRTSASAWVVFGNAYTNF